MGTFRVPIEIGDPQGQRYETVQALVDTGATYTTVPASLLRRLGIVPRTRAPFRLADGSLREMELGQTWIRVDGHEVITIVVFGDEGSGPLLGAYALEGLLLAPDPVGQRLVPVSGLLM
ncbi:MAG: retroviral-like aspartic protease family protein [Chloroflexi bacterium]|nr:retroviral-like aspartic protease family protein [Chloroflexota bacterium]